MYKEVLKKYLTIWRSLLIIVAQEFSLTLLLKTLFAPWRRDIAPPGRSLDEILRNLLLNLVSRFIGFLVRFFTILTCLIFELLISLAFASGFPFVLAFGWLIRKKKEIFDKKAKAIFQKSRNSFELLFHLTENERVGFILNHLGLSFDLLLESQKEIKECNLQAVFDQAKKVAENFQNEKISPSDLFYGLYLSSPSLSKFFEDLKIKKDDFLNLYLWEKAFYETLHQPSPLLFPEKIRTSGGIGRLWASGYTPFLDQYSYEIQTHILETSPLHFQAHKETISEIEMVLGRSGKHNVILVGEPGTGKRTAFLGFAQKVIFGQTIPSLAHRRIIELNVDALSSGAVSISEIEERFLMALNEAVRAGNIILFIDNIERLFEPDISSIFLPYLQRTDFQLVGTATPDVYFRFIQPNPQLSANFEKIEIKEPDKEEVLKILEEIALYLEGEKEILILYQTLKEVVNLAKRYLPERKFPEKAIDLLDESVSYLVNQKKEKVLMPEDVSDVVSLKTEIPVGEVEISEREKLLRLEEEFHKRLVNQDEAVKAISEALRRARAGLGKENKPIGSFLFLGPTGCGKTECAKILALVYFGHPKNMLRFDMSEYKEERAISQFLGEEGEPGIFTSKVRENPFSLILLDEIEKASPSILNLFLQVLDEGRLTDRLGHTVDFTNTIIIGTSNAGSEWIREQIKQGKGIDKKAFLDYLLKEGYFKIEFLNRFDGIIAFRPLNEKELEKVTELLILDLQNRLSEKQITIVLEEGAKRKLAEIGFDPQFGARALARVIQEKVEGQIAKEILEGKLPPGSTYTIREEDIR